MTEKDLKKAARVQFESQIIMKNYSRMLEETVHKLESHPMALEWIDTVSYSDGDEVLNAFAAGYLFRCFDEI